MIEVSMPSDKTLQIKQLHYALHQDFGNPSIHRALARTYQSVGHYYAALQEYKYEAVLSQDAVCLIEVVDIYVNSLRQVEMGRSFFEQAARIAPTDAGVMFWNAWFAFHIDQDVPTARKSIEELVARHAEDKRARVLRAEIQLAAGQFQQALEAISSVLADCPDDVYANRIAVRADLKAGNFRQALERLKVLCRTSPNDAQLPFVIYNCGLAADSVGETVPLLLGLVGQNPGSANHCLILGRGLIRNQQYQEAIQALTQAQRLDPLHAEISLEMGLCWMKLGNLGTAAECLNDAIQHHPDRSDAHYLRGLVAYRQKELDRAENELQRVLEIDDTRADACYLLGRICLEAHRSPQRAEDRWRAALKADPKHAWARASLAVLLYRQGKTDLAQRELAEGLQLTPHSKALQDIAQLVSTQGE